MDSGRFKLKDLHPVSLAAGYCIVRSSQQQTGEVDRLLFSRYPEREWGTFFRFGYRRTKWGLAVTWVDLMEPAGDDLRRDSHVVEFAPAYVRRAQRALDQSRLGIGVIHSHPEGCFTTPSWLDDDMDSYFGDEFDKLGNARPYLSLIIARDDEGRRRFSGRAYVDGKWLPVSDWLVSGNDELKRYKSSIAYATPQDATNFGSLAQERFSQLLGDESIGRMKTSIVGVVGCSGLGTPAGHVLARAGVGGFVLVDKGLFKASNHERNHASQASDLEKNDLKKVDLLERLIHEVNPRADVVSIAGDILDDEVVDELLRCDLVLGCTDSVYARAALGDLATHYLIPVIDLGVQMRASEGLLLEQVGEIARYSPGLPCPWCRNRVQANRIREETMTEAEAQLSIAAAEAARTRGEDGAQYWAGSRDPELTVGYLTTAVGAIGAGYAEHWLIGCAQIPHDRFQFDLGLKEFGFVKDGRAADPDCSCQTCIGLGDQGKAHRSVTQPDHWRTSTHGLSQ